MKLAKQITIVTALILFCFLVCNSQQTQTNPKPNSKAKPDLSGTWVFFTDNEKDMKIIPDYATKKGISCLKEIRLKIEHTEPQLKFFYTFVFAEEEKTFEEIYYSDSRKEKNADSFYECDGKKIIEHAFDSKTETVSYWKGNSLLTRTEALENFQKQIEVISELTLSKDGQTLTMNVRIISDPKRNWARSRQFSMFFDDVVAYERKFHRAQETK